ncbi:MAG: Xaa-Pro aminopeptidase [Myxococcales bacterium]|nr:Xaa-Pro aminopeptidase [Myxococcales bacterium]
MFALVPALHVQLASSHRETLAERMRDAVAVFFAAPEQIRNRDVHHDYRQESDFFYLTGFEEPESVLVVAPHRAVGDRTAIFLRKRDLEAEVWDGERMGVERAPEALGVDKAFEFKSLATELPKWLAGARRLYFSLGRNAEDDEVVVAAMRAARMQRKTGAETPGDLLDPEDLLHEQRLIKSPEAIASMRRAATLANIGHRKAMAVSRPGVFEFQLQAAMEYEWGVRGARRTAYSSIVGSGPNACVLHYRSNARQMEAGDLVLIDAGCEVDYFASDVTRTFPVSGKFTEPQRRLYALVLAAQKAGIARCRSGYSFEQVHEATVRVLTEGLVELGLLIGPVEDRIKDEGFKRYYMHRTSHWLGMDVHDVGRYYVGGTSRALEPGMTLTVEPGLYISSRDQLAPEEYRGIGIRIEDDVLVTDGAPDVLSAAIPKEIDDLEALIGTEALSM